jgi:hypothetical protein
MEKKTFFTILVLVLLLGSGLVLSQISGPSNLDGLNFYWIKNFISINATDGSFTRLTIGNITLTNPNLLSNTHSHTFQNVTGLPELNTTATNLVASNGTKAPYSNPSQNINWTSKNLTIQCLVFNSGGTICST